MTERENINKFLAKVLQSNTFSKSVVNKELFKYLVNQSRKGEVPKEFQIADEIFGKKASSNEDKNVRVYILNLRKKITEYYKLEGLNDAVKFALPKGGYEIIFKFNRVALFKAHLYNKSPLILATSIFFLTISFFVLFSKDTPKVTKSFIWNNLYKSDYPTLIILGDHYFFREQNVLGDFYTVRSSFINSDKDLDSLIIKNPQLVNKIEKTEQTYINKQAPYGLFKIMNFLGGEQTEIEFQYSSNLQWEHVENRNVIFIGSYKTQNILQDIHIELGIDYHINESRLYYEVNDTIYEFGSESEDLLITEYASFSRFITKDKRNVISFMCNSDVGNIAVLKYLSQPENLKKIKKLTKNFSSPNFKAVFEVRGQGFTDFQIIMKRLDPIGYSIDELWP